MATQLLRLPSTLSFLMLFIPVSHVVAGKPAQFLHGRRVRHGTLKVKDFWEGADANVFAHELGKVLLLKDL